MFGKAGLGDLLRQAGQLQEKMADARDKMEAARHTGSAGDGKVRIVLDGKHQLIELHIDPSALSVGDVTALERLIREAYTEARDKASAAQKELLSSLTGGLSIPGLNL